MSGFSKDSCQFIPLCGMKLGHAIHLEHKFWANHIFNDRIRNVAKKLGLKKPVVLQSMLIYKNPKVGGEGEFIIKDIFLLMSRTNT